MKLEENKSVLLLYVIVRSLAVFEVSAAVSRMHREKKKILREFYIMDENSILYDINESLIKKSYKLHTKKGFDQLRGADLVFACIAYLENAYLVTLDKVFQDHVSDYVKILDLNESRTSPEYRRKFEE